MKNDDKLLKPNGAIISVTVKGWLSPEDEKDKENKSRRDHVYKKFGFEIKENWAILENLSSLSN